MAILPTPYEKSLTYVILPFAVADAFCIIVVPLNATIEQQSSKLSKMCQIIEVRNIETLKECKYLIGHPEEFIAAASVLRELSTKTNKNFYIFVDECHCILEGDRNSDFNRKIYNIYELRTMLGGPFRCTTAALTANASAKAQEEIMTNLRMKDAIKIVMTPIKENIRLSLVQRETAAGDESSIERSYEYVLTSLFETLKEKGDIFPMSIIYISIIFTGVGSHMS